MRITTVILACIAACHFVVAQDVETIPQEDAAKAAKLAAKALSSATDIPLAMELDVEKAFALRAMEAGALIIPVKNLTALPTPEAGKGVKPLGQLWTLKIVPTREGKPVAKESLRQVKIQTDERTYEPYVFFLGIQQNKKGQNSLTISTNVKKPILRIPLQPMDAKQDLPIELTGHGTEGNAGLGIIKILGKYQAELPVEIEME